MAVDAEEETGAPKESKKKLIYIIAAAVLLLIITIGGVYLFFGDKVTNLLIGDGNSGQDLSGNYMAIDEMLITIKSDRARQQYLKFKYSFELVSVADSIIVIQLLPRIIDDYQAFLRELRVEELQGSEGWYRLKEELLIRANTILAPVRIKEVLISELVIQ